MGKHIRMLLSDLTFSSAVLSLTCLKTAAITQRLVVRWETFICFSVGRDLTHLKIPLEFLWELLIRYKAGNCTSGVHVE